MSANPLSHRSYFVKPLNPDPFPLAYHITFTCYGTRLHGDTIGTVQRTRNIPGTRCLRPDPARSRRMRRRMRQPPYELDTPRRKIVLEAIIEVCARRGWLLLAAHVRTRHVHVVLRAARLPEGVMDDLKAYASRRLTEAGFDWKDRRRWTRHGSTKWKWTLEEVGSAVDYVVRGQGEPMEVYEMK